MTTAAKLQRQARHWAGKTRKARTPLRRTGVAFDEWRRRVTELPAELADAEAVEMESTLRREIERLRPRVGDQA